MRDLTTIGVPRPDRKIRRKTPTVSKRTEISGRYTLDVQDTSTGGLRQSKAGVE